MRVSIREDDPGYKAYIDATQIGKRVLVFLDGTEQHSCITADDETGEMVRCVVDDKGNAQVNPNKLDEIWVETVTGKVEIKFEDID